MVSYLLTVGYAHALDIYIAVPEPIAPGTLKTVNDFKVLTDKEARLWSELVSAKTAGKLYGNNNLIIAIGEEALRTILKGPGDSRVIAAFIRRPQYEALVSAKKPLKRKVTAVFSDPSPSRQLALIKVLFGSKASAGIVNTSYMQPFINEYQDAAKHLGVALTVLQQDNLLSVSDLLTKTTGTKTLILNRDPILLKKFPLDDVKHQALDVNRQGLIGFSSGLVKRGGLATTYASLEDTVGTVSLGISYAKTHQDLLPQAYTKGFSIAINQQVSDVLDLLSSGSEAEMAQEIHRLLEQGGAR